VAKSRPPRFRDEPVAQLVEQRPFKPWVLGSNPSRLTTSGFPFVTASKVFYFLVGMLGSWDQPRVRGPLDRFSGSMRSWLGHFGSVVHLILWACGIVFLLQVVCEAVQWPIFDDLFALNGKQFFHGFFWQPVTYMFLHGGPWHILINLLILWFFGREVEYFIGPKYFTRLYLLGGMIGGALWLAFNFQSPGVLMGASAAVLACVIAFATLFPDREVTLLVFFVLPVTLKAKYLALVAIAFDVVPVLSRTDPTVAHLAHLGGAAIGYVYIKQLGYGRTPRWLQWLQSVGQKLHPPRQPKPRPQTREEFISQQVDPILDKIAREGMHSLTRHERKILESAKDLMQNKQR
jgi:membrane associated rhomboid family serine protease